MAFQQNGESKDEEAGAAYTNICFTLGPGDTGSISEKNKVQPIQLPETVEEEKSHWVSQWLANGMYFFAGLCLTMFYPTLWPFINSMDPTTDETFVGYVVAINNVGEAIGAPLLGWWSHKIKGYKTPLATCFALMVFANVLYCFSPVFPQASTKWVLFAARFICGLGQAFGALTRSYLASASSHKDRARAMAINSGAWAVGLTFGPAIQAAFTPIGYPGIKLGGVFHLNMYTAPALFTVIINLLLLVLLYLFFEEHQAKSTEAEKSPYFALPKYDRVSALVCIFAYFVYCISFTNMETIQTPYTMAMYDWGDTKAAEYNSLILAAQGVVSLIFVVIYAWKLGYIIDLRIVIVTGLGLIVLFHILTFPWPFFPESLSFQITDVHNVSTNANVSASQLMAASSGQLEHVGCTMAMRWCQTTPRVPLWLFIATYVGIVGIAMPATMSGICSLYSQILGPRSQGTMHGVMSWAGCLARIAGPIVIMQLFTYSGAKMTWGIEGALAVIGIIPVFVFWKRMTPLKTENQMKAGDSFSYKRGMLYKF